MNLEKNRTLAHFVRESRVQIYERLMDAELALDTAKSGAALIFIHAAADIFDSLKAQIKEQVVDDKAKNPATREKREVPAETPGGKT